ncbi:MAG: hypothetical protein NT119_04055 [Actinobacteria bacterium]|nr:hypothetical protein [Actinomycetota bacterium]
MRFHLTYIALASLTLSFFAPAANADEQVGGDCKKLGETAVDPSGFKHKCIKSGNKLIWDEGIKTNTSSTQNKVDSNSIIFAWPSTTAKYITSVPIDLNQINSISKYAGCSGHNRDGYTFERVLTSNLSLKHYFYPIAQFQGTTDKVKDKVKVFAPFDGTVATIQLEANKGGMGRPKNGNGLGLSTPLDKNILFSFGHIYFLKSFKVGDSVKAGQLLGYASMSDAGFDFDIDLEGKSRASNESEVLGSIFDHMAKSVLGSFAEHGISPNQMKIAIVDRQKQPCDFNSGVGRTTADWVALKGQTIKTGTSSPQGSSASSSNTSKPTDAPKSSANTDSESSSFQKEGQACDSTKGPNGKASDGTQLVCKPGSDGKDIWQVKK